MQDRPGDLTLASDDADLSKMLLSRTASKVHQTPVLAPSQDRYITMGLFRSLDRCSQRLLLPRYDFLMRPQQEQKPWTLQIFKADQQFPPFL